MVKCLDEEKVFYNNLYPFTDLPRTGMESLKWNLYITDTTLRDGQQAWRPLKIEEAVKVYQLLNELDAGSGIIKSCEFFLYTDKDREVVRRVKELGYDYPKPIAWIRATFSDLKLVEEAGLDKAVILSSISDYHIYYKLRLSRSQAVEKYLSVIEEALKKGISVRASLEDITRADIYGLAIPFIHKVFDLGEKYGVEVEVKIADTLGLGLPFEEVPLPRSIPRIVKALIRDGGVPGEKIEFHGHNDFHMVVANHVVAWISGASMSNCTLLGMGERAGNCPLEAMALFYVQLKGTTGGMNLKVLKKIKEFFEEIGFEIPEFQPILGANAFRTKAGIHIDGLLKNPQVYLSYDPNAVLGIPYTVSITPYSGRAGVAFWLKSMFGSSSWEDMKNDPRLAEIYNEITEIYKTGRTTPITDREMITLLKKHVPEILEKYRDKLPRHLRGLI